MSPEVGRVVALGASNLTRGFRTVVDTARSVWGPGVEVMAAFGHGRSYGAPSRFIGRTLPGILKSGLWAELDRRSRVTTRGLVTDVGNDILYGFSVERTLEWVEEVLVRLSQVTQDIVLTDLPLASVRRMSNLKYLAFRTVLVPNCRLTRTQVLDRAERVNEGLASLAETYGATFFRLDPKWYGFDPIHVRPSLWRTAWQKILGAESQTKAGGAVTVETMKLYFMRPERRWLFGVEQLTPQAGVALRSGGHIWLY
ncbi:MAG TPA: hypothetical protein VFX56_03880 [Nitrospira sp.]|nr:hypothetical protein [Nitrospira sp.]